MPQKSITTALIVVFFYSIALTAQETASGDKDTLTILQTLKYDGITALQALGSTYTAPLRWKKNKLLLFSGTVAATGLLYVYDEETLRFFEKQNKDVPNFFKEFGWYYGSPQNNYMLMGTIYGVGLFTKNEKIRQTGVLLITSATAAGIIQSVSKTVVGRARPSRGEGKHSFEPFSPEGTYHSFPSGHTILSVTTSHVIAKQFKNIWVKSGIYAVGTIAPLSRMWAEAHWFTDVFIGAVISIATVEAVDSFLKNNSKYPHEDLPPREKKMSWNLRVSPRGIGITGRF